MKNETFVVAVFDTVSEDSLIWIESNSTSEERISFSLVLLLPASSGISELILESVKIKFE